MSAHDQYISSPLTHDQHEYEPAAHEYEPAAHEYEPAPREYDPAPPEYAGGQTPPDSPRSTLVGAIRRHSILVLIPVLLLLGAGVVVGNGKPRTYTANAVINVGKSDIATQATPGYVQAAAALATSYSRLVTSQFVAIPAGRALHESPLTAASQLSAVPIPNETTFTLTAKGSSPRSAVALANAAVTALQAYVKNTATQQGGPQQLLGKYEAAQSTADQLQAKAQRLTGRLASATAAASSSVASTSASTSVTQSQVTKAKVAAQSASLQAQALSNQYLNLAGSAVAPTLSVLNTPTGTATSNRTQNIEKYGIIGAAAGLVIGIAFAALVARIENWRGLRRRRALV
ncbi:MAG: hypothetical protein ACRDNK_24845 [Solirubrobacteraceae bacterium]